MTDRTKLTGPQAAARAGVTPSRWRTLTNPIADRGGRIYGPPPDGYTDPCGCPWWWDATVDTYIQSKEK
jgi:hypothetical protein